ncbi:hypothetical membrane protein, conserved [Thermococcus kodakarensis KOD1]|uniref:Hypothetical membrane protein, conserved n=1 Tax=Thermococcus kodakarensis (strain ATCC BAA-918 / JCM 12380 / KOD1) TaxID=69014 RepID=Q5JE25_THEKO|nr:hypothetical protein [Thermococcus kodakarensis]WCN29046.1 hypothetical protein POG15_05520 [Thermococcus kodakarensis]WCN31351.1 hypothetical protein POG21_05520 [Thermococcus kodakarensis]BAD85279.1 hypothetical membrane protein, conserved [Thermococcus kodakarensis KOD1]
MHGALGLGLLAIGIAGLIALLIALVIAGFVLYLGTELAGIKKASLGKSIVAVVGGGILAGILFIIPVLGWILGIVAYIWVIKVVFDTDWLRATLAFLMAIIIEVIVLWLFKLLLGISLLAAL